MMERPRYVRIEDGGFTSVPSIFTQFPHQKGLNGGSEVLSQWMLQYDSRDSVDIPRAGTLARAYYGIADRRFGSSISYNRFGGELRQYYTVGERITFAGHIFNEYQPVNGEIPFWSQARLGGDESLLTDQETLRGYGAGRFIDNNLFVMNVEMRTRVWDKTLFGTHGILELAPFAEAGRVAHNLSYNPVLGNAPGRRPRNSRDCGTIRSRLRRRRMGWRRRRRLLRHQLPILIDRRDVRADSGSARRPNPVRRSAILMRDNRSDGEYYERLRALLEDSYVSADERGNVLGGSGSSGDMVKWEGKRRVIASAFDRSGTWLDVGCANGLLMETLAAWVAENGHYIEPYGLDLSERIAERARKRLPHWAARIWTGNVMEFEPSIRFDYVTTLADSVPIERRPALVRRLARLYLKPGGRLILSCYGYGAFLLGMPLAAESAAEILSAAGFEPNGEADARDALTGAVKVRVAWTDVIRS